MLSMEANLKAKALETPATRDKVKELGTLFEMHDYLEEVADIEESVLLTAEGLQVNVKRLDSIGVRNQKQLLSLRDFLLSVKDSLEAGSKLGKMQCI